MPYYKEINGRKIFSTPEVPEKKLFITSLNAWRSNPSAEDIVAEGWIYFTQPVTPPMEPEPQTEPEMEAVLEAVKKLLSTETAELSDEDALAVASLFPTWSSKIGEMVNAGERLWYDKKLYKVLQPHTVQEDWTPDVSASLFVEISIEEWPDYVQPTGTQDAYNTGDRVTFSEHRYICKMDNCVWSPADYPAAWELVE